MVSPAMSLRPFYIDNVGRPSQIPGGGHAHLAGLCRGVIFFATLAGIVMALAGAAAGPPTFGASRAQAGAIAPHVPGP